jgi:alpha-galactosidase
MTVIAEIRCDPGAARIYEHGWQSWSPAGVYPARGRSPRPARPLWQTMAFRPERPAPDAGFQGEGLLVVEPGGDEPLQIFSAPEPERQVASIRAEVQRDRIVVSSDEPVRRTGHRDGIEAALVDWADGMRVRARLGAVEEFGPAWCSWYGYWGDVTAAHVAESLKAIDELALDVTVVQVDDGWQRGIGDWDGVNDRFGDLPSLAQRIRDSGRRAGIWLAPLMVGEHSATAREHPDWLVRGADAGFNWDQRLHALDVTHPDAAEALQRSIRWLAELGFDYFKIDFLYAGAMEGLRHEDTSGIDAYREGLRLIRDAAGERSTLLGCGAPLLPSIGLVDAMRVSPDVAPQFEPADGDVSQPSMRGALLAGRARAFQHARLWVNDPDCLLARPGVERREAWAEHVEAHGGLVVSGDPLRELDDWGLETTRRLLSAAAERGVR